MSQWNPEQLQQLLDERDPQQLFKRALALVQDMGMPYMGLALHIHLAATDRKSSCTTTSQRNGTHSIRKLS